jgi:hypothetical protein
VVAENCCRPFGAEVRKQYSYYFCRSKDIKDTKDIKDINDGDDDDALGCCPVAHESYSPASYWVSAALSRIGCRLAPYFTSV